jgi:hypothetical protein
VTRAISLVGLTCLLVAAPVFAAESAASKKEAAQKKQEAADHYKKGVALFKEGDFASALAEFRAAYQAVPSFEVLYNLGLTERRLFKYGQAVKTFNRYLEEGGKKVPADRRESVESELSIIRSLTSKVTVTVEGAPAKVFANGEEVGTSPLAEPILLGPGRHVLRATRDGEPDAEESFELASGSVKAVTLTFKPKASQGPVDVTVETDPREAVLMVDGKLAGLSPAKLELTPGSHELIAELDGYQSARTDVVVEPGKPRTVKLKLVPGGATGGKGRFPVVGVVFFGVAVAAGGLAALFGVQAGNASRQVTEFFRTGGAWDASRGAVESQGLRDQTLAGVFIGVSAAALVGGIIATVITLVGPAESSEAHFFLVPGPSGVTAAWSTRF